MAQDSSPKRPRPEGGAPQHFNIGSTLVSKWRRVILRGLFFLNSSHGMSMAPQSLKDLADMRYQIGITTKPGESGREETKRLLAEAKAAQKVIIEDAKEKAREAQAIMTEAKKKLADAKKKALVIKAEARAGKSTARSSSDPL